MSSGTAPTPARDIVLQRIQSALGNPAAAPSAVESEWAAIQRLYRRRGTLAPGAVLEQLEDRLRDYDAHVEQVTPAEIISKIAELLTRRGITRLVVPVGLPQALGAELPPGFDFHLDTDLPVEEIDQMEGVVTACAVAISQTGTLVLQTVAGQGRRAPTLVPDYHLCVVRATDVVETVAEAFERLAPTASLATTFISGPSATADIEMTRIKGVHGPRFLDVILVL